MVGDLAEITSGELYLKNEPASVKYSTNSGMADAEALTVAKPAIYIVYKPYVKLTVKKTVDGEYGNRTKDFEFTLSVDGAPSSASYKIKKSSSDTSSTVSNGGTFTLRHDENAELIVPKDVEITLTETAVSGYTESLGTNKPTGATLTGNAVKFTLGDEDATLDIVNTFDDTKIVPTGISGHMNMLMLIVLAFVLATAEFYILMRRRRVSR
jgi:hypothetical protein